MSHATPEAPDDGGSHAATGNTGAAWLSVAVASVALGISQKTDFDTAHFKDGQCADCGVRGRKGDEGIIARRKGVVAESCREHRQEKLG